MNDSLKNKFVSGIAWTFIQNVVVKVLGVIFMILMTRILTPGDYGLVGMLSIFIAISEVFILSGFGEALIQKKDCTEDDFSTAFYFNFCISIIIYLILFISAPFISTFYHEPQLISLTRILALNFVLGSLNIVQQSKLTKRMNFKPLAIITLISTLIGGILGVIMAYLGYGVWALVAQTLSATISRVFLFPFFTRWHPSRPFSRMSFVHLWRYGSRLLVTGVIGVIIRNVSNILIGRFYDKNQVGYYTRSQSLAAVPSETLYSVLSSVTFPALCEVQDEKERWFSLYRKVLFNTVLIVCPIIILMVLLARPIIIILFTEKWAACIPLFQALLLARMFLPVGATHTSMLRSAGNTTLYMKLYFITGPLTLVAIVISIPFGVVAMAWATFFAAIVNFIIESFIIGRKFGYSLLEQVWDWRKIFLSLLVMSVLVCGIVYWFTNLWIQLFVGLSVGVLTYSICCKVFGLVDNEMQQMILKIIPFGRRCS